MALPWSMTKTRTRTIRVDDALWEAAAQRAGSTGVSEVIRRALQRFVGNGPEGFTGGTLLPGDGTIISHTRFHAAAIAPRPDATDVVFNGCTFTDCDLSALEWRSLRFCTLEGCALPERGDIRDALGSRVTHPSGEHQLIPGQ